MKRSRNGVATNESEEERGEQTKIIKIFKTGDDLSRSNRCESVNCVLKQLQESGSLTARELLELHQGPIDPETNKELTDVAHIVRVLNAAQLTREVKLSGDHIRGDRTYNYLDGTVSPVKVNIEKMGETLRQIKSDIVEARDRLKMMNKINKHLPEKVRMSNLKQEKNGTTEKMMSEEKIKEESREEKALEGGTSSRSPKDRSIKNLRPFEQNKSLHGALLEAVKKYPEIF